jgi:hypothetical protein
MKIVQELKNIGVLPVLALLMMIIGSIILIYEGSHNSYNSKILLRSDKYIAAVNLISLGFIVMVSSWVIKVGYGKKLLC